MSLLDRPWAPARILLVLLAGVGAGCDGTVGGAADGASGSGGFAGWGGSGGTGMPWLDAAVDSDAAIAADANGLDAALSDGAVVDAAVDAAEDAAVGPVRPAYEALFDESTLPTFEITLPQSSWDALEADGDVYQPATLRYGAIVLENVGVRIKGRASRRGLDEKPALKIKVNEFVPGQRLLGLKRITLNNMVQDPSMVRERLGYAVFREMGVPAPLCNHARVYLNGEFYGLYANVQTLDDVFVRSHWSPAPGNLYDITNDEYHIDFERERRTLFDPNPPAQETKFILETNEDINDTSDLTALINAVSTSSNGAFMSEVEAVMDLDEVLALGGVQAVISDWDGYFGARNNYKAYHELSQDRFILFPWGIDQTFGIQDDVYNKLNYNIDHSGSERPRSLIFDRCEDNDGCLARYHAQVALALDAFERLDLEAALDVILVQVQAAILEDTRKPYSNAEHMDAMDDLRNFLSERPDIVRAQLP